MITFIHFAGPFPISGFTCLLAADTCWSVWSVPLFHAIYLYTEVLSLPPLISVLFIHHDYDSLVLVYLYLLQYFKSLLVLLCSHLANLLGCLSCAACAVLLAYWAVSTPSFLDYLMCTMLVTVFQIEIGLPSLLFLLTCIIYLPCESSPSEVGIYQLGHHCGDSEVIHLSCHILSNVLTISKSIFTRSVR